MLIFVFGGSGSGKSEYAEKRILEAGKMPRYYVATMEPFGEEGKKRIERHRKLRAGKGFETIECATHLERLQLPKKGVVLLEDLSNLLSNEIWSENGRGWSGSLAEDICRTIKNLADGHQILVVVGNDIHRDGEAQTPEMEQYASLLAECQTRLAAVADEVVEVVCGIPITQVRAVTDQIKRLVFADDDDRIYKDDEYKNGHKAAYIKQIKADISGYKAAFSKIEYKIDIAGKDANEAADYIISQLGIK